MKRNKLINYIEELKKENLLLEENISNKLKEEKVENLTYDSRDVKENTLFVCKGINFKKEYLDSALKLGAMAYISEEEYKIIDKPYIIVKDIRKSLAILSALFTN